MNLPPGPVTPSIRDSIEKAIAVNVPEGKNGALLGVVSNDGVRVVVAGKIGNSWQLEGDVERAWGGNVSGQISVMYTW